MNIWNFIYDQLKKSEINTAEARLWYFQPFLYKEGKINIREYYLLVDYLLVS